jgi:hypothetical protein
MAQWTQKRSESEFHNRTTERAYLTASKLVEASPISIPHIPWCEPSHLNQYNGMLLVRALTIFETQTSMACESPHVFSVFRIEPEIKHWE